MGLVLAYAVVLAIGVWLVDPVTRTPRSTSYYTSDSSTALQFAVLFVTAVVAWVLNRWYAILVLPTVAFFVMRVPLPACDAAAGECTINGALFIYASIAVFPSAVLGWFAHVLVQRRSERRAVGDP